MGDSALYLWRYAIALIAHDDDAMVDDVGGGYVIAIEEGAVDWSADREAVEICGKVAVHYLYAGNAAHSGLDYLRVPDVRGVAAADDGLDAEPVCYADDGAKVAGVLDAVEGEGKRKTLPTPKTLPPPSL